MPTRWSPRPTSRSCAIWYRQGDLEALGTLETELSQWKEAKKRDLDLAGSLKTAIKLKKGDLEGSVQGMKSLINDDVTGIFDPALVELNLEVCADAVAAADHSGIVSMRGTFQNCWAQLVRRLYRIERPGGVKPAGRGVEKNGRKASA